MKMILRNPIANSLSWNTSYRYSFLDHRSESYSFSQDYYCSSDFQTLDIRSKSYISGKDHSINGVVRPINV